MKVLLSFLFCALVLSTYAEKQKFDRYQSIIDRQPFGPVPAGFNPQRMASEVTKGEEAKAEEQLSAEQEAIQKAVGFNMLNVENDGTIMIGFTDQSVATSPKHYYLAVGEVQDGWCVKECNQKEETIIIDKDGIEISLKLGATPATPTNARQARGAAAGRPPAVANNRSDALIMPKPAMLRKTNETNERVSFKSRRARREEERAKEAAAAKAEADAREQKRAREAEERAMREVAEKEAHEKELAEQKRQLNALHEEIRKVREAAQEANVQKNDNDNQSQDSENSAEQNNE